MLDVQHLKGLVCRCRYGDRPASLLVVPLRKALLGIASTFKWLDW